MSDHPYEQISRIILLVTATIFLILHPAFGAWPQETPQRVISTAPAVTEYLFYFGLGDRVAGISSSCDFPPEAMDRERVADMNLDLEKILALQPDLVILMKGLRAGEAELLTSLQLNVLALDLDSLAGIRKALTLLGQTFQCPDRVAVFLEKLDAGGIIPADDYRPRVYLETWGDPLMTAGRESFITDMIHTAGGTNIFADLPVLHPQISLEEILRRDPEVIIAAWPEGGDQVRNRPLLRDVSAVRMNRIHSIDPDLIVRPGPRIIEGLTRIRALLHP